VGDVTVFLDRLDDHEFCNRPHPVERGCPRARRHARHIGVDCLDAFPLPGLAPLSTNHVRHDAKDHADYPAGNGHKHCTPAGLPAKSELERG